jgi:hypothetical protein
VSASGKAGGLVRCVCRLPQHTGTKCVMADIMAIFGSNILVSSRGERVYSGACCTCEARNVPVGIRTGKLFTAWEAFWQHRHPHTAYLSTVPAIRSTAVILLSQEDPPRLTKTVY